MIMTYLKYTMQTVEMFLFCNTIQGKYCSSVALWAVDPGPNKVCLVVHQVSDNMDQDIQKP